VGAGCSNLIPDTGYPEVIRDFPQILQKNAGAVPKLSHDRFPSNPSEFITY
jgi:hypothetical protein